MTAGLTGLHGTAPALGAGRPRKRLRRAEADSGQKPGGALPDGPWVLNEFTARAGMVLTYDQLLLVVWDMGHSGNSGLVRTIATRPRQKLGDDANDTIRIFAEPSVGFRIGRRRNRSR